MLINMCDVVFIVSLIKDFYVTSNFKNMCILTTLPCFRTDFNQLFIPKGMFKSSSLLNNLLTN